MDAELPEMLKIAYRVLRYSAFVLAVSVVAGLLIGWIDGRIIFGGIYVTLVFFCGFMGLAPFRDNVIGVHAVSLMKRLLIFVESTLIVVVLYFVAVVLMWYLDRNFLNWVLDTSHFYIAYPAVVYVLMAVIVAVAFLFSRLRSG